MAPDLQEFFLVMNSGRLQSYVRPSVRSHMTADLIGGSRNSYVATLVERHSRYVMLIKVANKDTESVRLVEAHQNNRRDCPANFTGRRPGTEAKSSPIIGA
jgi:IS30 family transposase